MSLAKYPSPHLVIPSVIEEYLDCACPIILDEHTHCFNAISQCGCINDTAFQNGISDLSICLIQSADTDNDMPLRLQITNVTDEINGTKFHIYEQYRKCSSCNNLPCARRNYVKAFVLSHGKWHL